MGTTLEPSWGRKEGREGEREGGREVREGIRMQSCREFCNFPIEIYLRAQSFFCSCCYFCIRRHLFDPNKRDEANFDSTSSGEKLLSFTLSLSFFPPLHG
jgi:hypothetical protein